MNSHSSRWVDCEFIVCDTHWNCLGWSNVTEMEIITKKCIVISKCMMKQTKDEKYKYIQCCFFEIFSFYKRQCFLFKSYEFQPLKYILVIITWPTIDIVMIDLFLNILFRSKRRTRTLKILCQWKNINTHTADYAPLYIWIFLRVSNWIKFLLTHNLLDFMKSALTVLISH